MYKILLVVCALFLSTPQQSQKLSLVTERIVTVSQTSPGVYDMNSIFTRKFEMKEEYMKLGLVQDSATDSRFFTASVYKMDDTVSAASMIEIVNEAKQKSRRRDIFITEAQVTAFCMQHPDKLKPQDMTVFFVKKRTVRGERYFTFSTFRFATGSRGAVLEEINTSPDFQTNYPGRGIWFVIPQ